MSGLRGVRELFDAAAQLAPAERAAFLADACAGDVALRAEVEQLLACDATISDPIAASVAAAAHAQLDTATPWIGERVGNYKIISELGHGGMGSVFLAERADQEYETRVAIKLIRGFPTRSALERLRRERQVLAGLFHPDIARLLDGGTTQSGQPYLVIEYIDGVALDEWCARAQPSLRTRLMLFRWLCLAVHYAHQRMVVHSDLKPNNVLVRSDGRPALLDFGIARLLDQGSGDARITELRAFTPDYASPEQLAGASVTSASDIYGLGLILYELLCGQPLRRPPGTGWRTLRPARIALQSGQSFIRADAGRIDGDLEHVVAHALHEEPAHRYSSAAALAGDIDRYFAGQPLEAGPDRLGYVLHKFARRHVFGVATAALFVMAAIGFGVWLAAERNRAVHAERAAKTQAATADRVTGFLLNLFKQTDPEFTRGREVSARELLDDGRKRLQGELNEEPVVKGRLLAALGAIYTSIGQPEQSNTLFGQSIRLLEDNHASQLTLADALTEQCRNFNSYKEYAKALDVCRKGLAIRRAALPTNDPLLARSLDELGIAEQGVEDFTSAAREHHAALDILKSSKGNEEEIASVHHNLGFLAHNQHDFPTARSEYARALSDKRALFGDDHPLTLNSLQGLAQTERDLGDTGAALRDFQTSLDLRIRVHGADSVPAARAHNELASLLQDLGEYAKAAPHYQETLRVYSKLLAPDSLDIAVTNNNLATLAEDRGDYAGALPLFKTSLQMRRAKLSEDTLSVARGEHNLARCLIENHQLAAAKPLLNAARTTRAAHLPANSVDRFDDEMMAAEWTLADGDAQNAEVQLRAVQLPAEPAQFRRRARFELALAQTLVQQKRFEEAEQLQLRAFDGLVASLGMAHPLTAAAATVLAQTRLDRGDIAGARQMLDPSLPILRASLVADAPTLRAAQLLASRVAKLTTPAAGSATKH